jgi:hypothetical protein
MSENNEEIEEPEPEVKTSHAALWSATQDDVVKRARARLGSVRSAHVRILGEEAVEEARRIQIREAEARAAIKPLSPRSANEQRIEAYAAAHAVPPPIDKFDAINRQIHKTLEVATGLVGDLAAAAGSMVTRTVGLTARPRDSSQTVDSANRPGGGRTRKTKIKRKKNSKKYNKRNSKKKLK